MRPKNPFELQTQSGERVVTVIGLFNVGKLKFSTVEDWLFRVTRYFKAAAELPDSHSISGIPELSQRPRLSPSIVIVRSRT